MKKTWWKEAVVYQVYWRSFFDTNGDGYGDLEGVICKLDYIKELDVDIIWLNPCYASPDIDNGYDISDYYAIMPKAGDLRILKKLLQETHQRGMKLILDLVVNHTSDQHPWFLESRKSKDNPFRDYYIWRKGKPGGEPPNNWRAYFTPSAWTYDEVTGEYYFHSFAVEQPDLNWESPKLREEIYTMMRYWLDQGFDGFRLDAIALLAKPKDFPDAINPNNIRYLTNNSRVHTYLREMNQKVFSHYDILTVGEVAFASPEEGLKYVDESRGELNTLFHFEICDEMTTWEPLRFKAIQRRWYEGLWGRGWNSQFLNNHDQTRLVSRFGNDQEYRIESAKLFATMLHTLPGMPYIYQGEEIGMTGVHFDSIEDYHDIAMKNKYQEDIAKGKDPQAELESLRSLSRDNARTPMQWNDTEHAGFTKGTPWMKVNPNYGQIHVGKVRTDPNSIYTFYKRLIQLRKENEVIVYGTYEPIQEDDLQIYSYFRTWENEKWLILLNVSDQPALFYVPMNYVGTPQDLILANYEVKSGHFDDSLHLKPYEARIYRITK
jgi:oligo-1,6-glucosidase